MNDYEKTTVNYFIPESVTFSVADVKKIHKAWQETWETDQAFEEMTEEDILQAASNLGLVDLPDGWKA